MSGRALYRYICKPMIRFPTKNCRMVSNFLNMFRSIEEVKGEITDNNSLLVISGGDEGDRTPDLGIANAALSQLSYIPKIQSKFKVIVRRPAGASPSDRRQTRVRSRSCLSGRERLSRRPKPRP